MLWRPGVTDPVPRLMRGRFAPGNPPTLDGAETFDMVAVPGVPDLWQCAAADCDLTDGETWSSPSSARAR